MREKQATPEKIIVIDIKLTSGLVVALSCALVLAVLLTSLTLAGDSASASEIEAAQAASTGMRQFYLTSATFNGAQVLNACAAGFHMASLWEIADPSNLKYNTALGKTRPDSGEGPPSDPGWVRTGYDSTYDSIAGRGNCDAWTTGEQAKRGSLVMPALDWEGSDDDIGVWNAMYVDCDVPIWVWCVED